MVSRESDTADNERWLLKGHSTTGLGPNVCGAERRPRGNQPWEFIGGLGRISVAQLLCFTHLILVPILYQPPWLVGCYRSTPFPTSYMRTYSISLALVGLAGSALAHGGPTLRRKTMGFGPVHPHAKFHTSPASFTKASVFSNDPYEIARSFVTELLQDQLSADNEFALRKDSYTDSATGVTHVYFRQMINGLEVADGDINVNIKGGTVISYGDSVSLVVTHHLLLHHRLIPPY